MISYWESKSFLQNADILIIGGGIIGLSAALWSKKLNPDSRILIIERGSLPSGASTKNAGFACFGSIGELIDDLKISSENEVFKLVKKRFEGLNLLRETLGDKVIRYISCGGYELFRENEKQYYSECSSQLESFNAKLKEKLNLDNTYTIASKQIENFGFTGVNGLIYNQYEGAIDTGEMMRNLWKACVELNIMIVCGIGVENLDIRANSVSVNLSNGYQLEAGKVIVATNAFARQLIPALEVQPARAQVLITEPIENLPFSGTFHFDRGYYFFRNVDKRILFGGGRNLDFESETTYNLGLTKRIQEQLEHYLHTLILPHSNVKIAQRWSGIMGVGKNKNPIIECLDKSLIVAVRMGGMGVAMGTLVGKEAAEMAK